MRGAARRPRRARPVVRSFVVVKGGQRHTPHALEPGAPERVFQGLGPEAGEALAQVPDERRVVVRLGVAAD